MNHPESVIDDSANEARRAFVFWQCQIRKFSVRELLGKPTQGVCPELIIDDVSLGVITTLLVPEEPEYDVRQLTHLHKKSFDPKERREGALKYLQSEFYQVPSAFSGELSALAPANANWINKVCQAKNVELLFEQDSRQWRFNCHAALLSASDIRWQVTLAHNQLFNHSLTSEIQVLLFKPVW